MRMASIYRLMGQFSNTEGVLQDVVQRCPTVYKDNPNQIFMCQNNLLKHYLENDVDKCVDYGNEILTQKDDVK